MKVIALGFILILSACAQSQQITTAVPDQTTPTPVVSEPATDEAVLTPPPTTDPVSGPPEQPAPAPEQHATPPLTTTATSAPSDSIAEKRLEKVQTGKTLLEVIREQGVPDDNINPGRKEQIAVYQMTGKYQFFFFRDSQLFSQGEYPQSTIEKMRQDNMYPQAVIQDLSGL